MIWFQPLLSLVFFLPMVSSVAIDQSRTYNGTIKAWDGTILHYTHSGPSSAPNLLFIPGWAQTAIQFKKQTSFFSQNYSVTAYDHRGQGDSSKPTHGYRISKLASDLNDIILQLNLEDVTLIGHSMGVSVIWDLWDTYPSLRKKIKILILIDQSSCLIANPSWTAEQATSLAAIFQPASSYDYANGLSGPDSLSVLTGFLRGMFTSSISDEDFQWMLEQNLKMSGEDAGTLLINHSAMDWRDVLGSINVPTLVIGGEVSLNPAQGIEYVAESIEGAELRIFTKEERGSHFMFWENSDLFNEVVGEFLVEHAGRRD